VLVGLSGFHGGVIAIPGPGTDMFGLHHHPADTESRSYSGSRKQFENTEFRTTCMFMYDRNTLLYCQRYFKEMSVLFSYIYK
jgi:hypothetical protein